MNAIRVQIDMINLSRALKLDSKTEIMFVGNYDFNTQSIEVVLSNEDFPKIAEGLKVPHACLLYEVDQNGELVKTRIETWDNGYIRI